MSMARLSAGAGYRYLLRHTAAGDAARPQATSLVDYYAATGYPPGRWLGSGLTGLNDGAGILSGSVVTATDSRSADHSVTTRASKGERDGMRWRAST
jgi:hypothetical protein